MPKNEIVSFDANKWQELTDTDVTSLCLQNIGAGSVHIMATTNATQPSNLGGAKRFEPGDILAANVDLADLYPGVTAGYRVWAFGELPGSVSVSHA
ncbi:MAG: hypothetical protein CML68_08650 [Rhodobacteraceae bacterium]|nr:hypothetical protein [Paracoccaceae bacterium]